VSVPSSLLSQPELEQAKFMSGPVAGFATWSSNSNRNALSYAAKSQAITSSNWPNKAFRT